MAYESKKALINCGKIIGHDEWSSNTEESEVKGMKIHYANKNYHAVPMIV